MSWLRVYCVASLVLLHVAAQASIQDYGVWHIRDAVQTGPSTLSNESAWLSAWITTTTSGEVTAATLTTPAGSSYNMSPDGNYEVAFGSKGYSWGDFDTEFSSGSYTFEAVGGADGGDTATLQVPTAVYPSPQPMLTAASYNALQNLHPADAVTLSWGSFKAGSNSSGWTFFTINDLTSQTNVTGTSGATLKCTGMTIPANTFQPGHTYWFSIKFDVYDSGLPGFGGKNGSADTAGETTGTFTLPGLVKSVALDPASVIGGNPSVATVTLNNPAPTGGATVSLTSSSSDATLPTSVKIAGGSSSATFTIKTISVGSVQTAKITATVLGTSAYDNLMIDPATVASVKASPASVVGGSTSSVTGTVTLSGAAPSGGCTVDLSSSIKAAATVPTSVKVAGGATSVSFVVTHYIVNSSQTVTIEGATGTVSHSATLVVNPLLIKSLTISPSSVTGGTSAIGTVTLANPVSAATAVKLSTTSSAIYGSTSVSVPANSSSATFTINSKGVSSVTTAVVVATLLSSTQQATLTINPPSLTKLTVSPTSVQGSSGTAVTGTVTISGIAPDSGFAVKLSSSSTSAATVPASVSVGVNATTVTFTVTHKKVTARATVTITATAGGVTKTATLTVTP